MNVTLLILIRMFIKVVFLVESPLLAREKQFSSRECEYVCVWGVCYAIGVRQVFLKVIGECLCVCFVFVVIPIG